MSRHQFFHSFHSTCQIHVLAGLVYAASTATAHAAPAGVSTGGCEVLASGMLRTNEYLHTYQGGCKNGLAEGEGKATWQLRNAESAPPITWQGRFAQSIFLAERQTVSAKRVDNLRVLLDLGPLDAPSGAQPGRLWVESRVEGKLPASACQPLSLQASTNGKLSDDAVAKKWLDNAYARWFDVCKQSSVDALKGRYLRVQLQEGTGWSPDSFGNIPAGVVQGSRDYASSVGNPKEWVSYTNRAAQERAANVRKQENAARDKKDAEDLVANQARVRAFAHKHGASKYAEIESLQKNPFRFGNDVILLAVRVREARTPEEAFVRSARSTRYEWSYVLLRGAIASWDEQGRIVAARVKGRSTDEQTRDAVILEMVASQRCETQNCEDYLLMPGKRWLTEDGLNESSKQ